MKVQQSLNEYIFGELNCYICHSIVYQNRAYNTDTLQIFRYRKNHVLQCQSMLERNQKQTKKTNKQNWFICKIMHYSPVQYQHFFRFLLPNLFCALWRNNKSVYLNNKWKFYLDGPTGTIKNIVQY